MKPRLLYDNKKKEWDFKTYWDWERFRESFTAKILTDEVGDRELVKQLSLRNNGGLLS